MCVVIGLCCCGCVDVLCFVSLMCVVVCALPFCVMGIVARCCCEVLLCVHVICVVLVRVVVF